ncbi:MAG: transcriptional regulator Spx [Acholeplasmatales bacterium]|jgi:regulatory protein spx|nr:transcriptional regulator Spx [Acholeplasmatales bacterium]
MVVIYTTPSCSSCRKAKKWLDQFHVEYSERNLNGQNLSMLDIDQMLLNADNGFDDIISTRSKVFKDKNLNTAGMSTLELKKFIINNPNVLKRPIILDVEKSRMQVGYNEDEIRIFIPAWLRAVINNPSLIKEGKIEFNITEKDLEELK